MNPEITSRRNPRVARARRLLRDASLRRGEGAWMLEGPKLVGEACEARAALRAAFYAPAFAATAEGADLLDRLRERGGEPICIAGDLLAWVATVESDQGIVLEITEPSRHVELTEEGIVLLASGVQDPGNVGALARVVEGAGGIGLFLLEGCADPGNPKALRGSAGSLLRLPVQRSGWPEIRSRLSQAGYRVAAATARGETRHTDLDWSGGWALAMGGEGGGLPAGVESAAAIRVRVPTRRIESLNVATAAAVLLFEAARRRGGDPARSGAD